MPKRAKKERQEKMSKEDRVRQQIKRMIDKTDKVRSKKQEEANYLTLQQNQLTELLHKSDNLDSKTLKDELKKIARSAKLRSQTQKMKRKQENKAYKDQRRQAKLAKKQEKQKWKSQKKSGKQQRKLAKQEKKVKLENARMESLPFSKQDINNQAVLYIHVDGYNIIGCDKICRKAMRNRGANKARKRLSDLISKSFLDEIKSGNLKLEYNVAVTIHFDGNGRDFKVSDDINIEFSSKKQIVDDKLVQNFSKNSKMHNANIVVITSDRELTLRLNDIGVKVMRSSNFYKKYLNKLGQNNNNNEEYKQNENETENENDDNAPDFGDDVDGELAKIFATKMNTHSDSNERDGEITPDDCDDNDDDDYTFDDVYDQVMGEVDED